MITKNTSERSAGKIAAREKETPEAFAAVISPNNPPKGAFFELSFLYSICIRLLYQIFLLLQTKKRAVQEIFYA